MNVLNSSTRNAIVNAISAGIDLNINLANTLMGTTSKERDELIFSMAHVVAAAYTARKESTGVIEAYASRKGNSITFGLLMDDGSHTRDTASDAARKWFSRNILNAGFITIKHATPKFSKAERLAATFERMTSAERKAFLRLIGQ